MKKETKKVLRKEPNEKNKSLKGEQIAKEEAIIKDNYIQIRKCLKAIVACLIVILVLELGYLGIMKIVAEKKSVYFTSANSIVEIDNGYVVIGTSDYKNSKTYDYIKEGYQKAYIKKLDKDYKLEKEVMYNSKYNSTFYDVLAVEDGYIAVGHVEMTLEHNTDKIGEALIVKYDKDLNIVWDKKFQILGNSTFYKIKLTSDDNYTVVGQSIYQNNIIGNHQTGGAIIVKYSKNGELLSQYNLGGPKSGAYNDFIEVKDGYIAVGYLISKTGIIVKYDFKGNIKWKKYYGYTDNTGLTAIELLDEDTFIVSGSKLLDKDDLTSSDALLLKYNLAGDKLGEKVYSKDSIDRFEDVVIDNTNIVAVGVYGKSMGNDSYNKSMITIYDKNLELTDEFDFANKGNDSFRKIIKLKNTYLVVGFTTSKVIEQDTNGKDLLPIYIEFDKQLNIK